MAILKGFNMLEFSRHSTVRFLQGVMNTRAEKCTSITKSLFVEQL